MEVKEIIDLSNSFVEDGYQNPVFDDGRIEVCMDHATAGWHAEKIIAATHTGTHIDSPLHKIMGGKSLDAYPLDRFFREAVVIDLYYKKEGEEILAEDIRRYDTIIRPGMIVLLATGWTVKKQPETKDVYLYHSPWLGESASRYLVAKKVNAVGIDHFSIGGADPEHVEIPHDILLGADILIFEGLYLPTKLLERETWTVAAFPIKAANASGMPARIVAF